MTQLKKNVFYTFLTQFPIQFLAIITGVFISRMLGPEGRAVYAIFIADVALFVTFFGFSMNSTITYFFSNGFISREKTFGISMYLVLFTVLLFISSIIIILYCGLDEIFFPKNHTTFLMMAWLFITSVFSLINTIFSSMFQGVKNFRAINRVSLINSLINITFFGVYYLLYAFYNFPVNPVFVLVLSTLIIIINTMQWVILFKKYFPGLRPDFNVFKQGIISQYLKYTGTNYLSGVINFLNYRFSLWVVAFYLTQSDTGQYTLAIGIAGMLSLVSTPVGSVLMPYLSSENSTIKKQMFEKYSRICFSILMISAIAGFLLSDFLIPIVYGAQFSPSVILFKIAVIGAVFSAQNRIIATYFMSVNRPNQNLFATLIGLLITLSLSFAIIPWYGSIGAVWVNTITYSAMFIYLYIVYLIEIKKPLKNIFFLNNNDIKNLKNAYEKKQGNS